jgi:hypothetical protein
MLQGASRTSSSPETDRQTDGQTDRQTDRQTNDMTYSVLDTQSSTFHARIVTQGPTSGSTELLYALGEDDDHSSNIDFMIMQATSTRLKQILQLLHVPTHIDTNMLWVHQAAAE